MSPPLAQPVQPPLAQPIALVTAPVVEVLSGLLRQQRRPLPETRVPTQNPEGTPARPVVVNVPPTQPRRPSIAAMKTMEMLKDTQSLATAMMLREVFDQPLCQRRRRGRN